MAIYRCNKCNHIEECENKQIGEDSACPKCGHHNKTWDTTFFVGKVLEKYFAVYSALNRLQAEQEETSENTVDELSSVQDFSNTDMLATPDQAQPVLKWFKNKQITVDINTNAVNTTGFFDEVANLIAANYATLRPVISQLTYAYQENHNGTTIKLVNRDKPEVDCITRFCKQLYEYAFISRLIQQKTEKTLRLILQPSPVIRSFFNGIWLEWFTLMQALEFASAREQPFSCVRNAVITSKNGEIHELDVFVLLNNSIPVCIECKAGDYRSYIEKYRLLKKSLGLSKAQFLLCIADLPDEHAQGLSSMYDLTFTNLKLLPFHLSQL
jgi:hypothetical protein